MGKRVIYSYFRENESRFIVDYLNDKHQWEPVFFHGGKGMRSWVQERYPHAVMDDAVEIRQANFDYSQIGSPAAIDEGIINNLLKYESNFLNWLQDTSGWNFNIFERRQHYYDLLKYWNTVITNLKPDLLVAYNMPHMPSDYPLYLLCKYHYNIPVVFYNPIPYLDDKYFTISDSLENLSSRFEKAYLSNNALEISDAVKKYLKELRSPKPQTPKHIKKALLKLKKEKRGHKLYFFKILKMILTGTAFRKSSAFYKKNRKPWDSDGSKLTNIEHVFFRLNLIYRKKIMGKLYAKISKPPRKDEKYIYFAAPYQPEVLSSLVAGVYENVFLILDMISQAIPDDWLIYYKEHPGTFKAGARDSLMRDQYFFERLKSYKNVKIIPCDTNTFSLIDKSQAVCTVGGTVGWEAVARGKPALVYGSLWYQSCKSVFTVKTCEDAAKAINQVMGGYVPDKDDVDRYAEAIFRASVYNLIGAGGFSEKITNYDDPRGEMERVGEAFYSTYKLIYGENKTKHTNQQHGRNDEAILRQEYCK